MAPGTITVLISQSGETADTIAAQREAKTRGSKTLAICNLVGSMIPREADGTIYTHVGPEIGVASTKTFTAQLTALYLLALYLAQLRGSLTPQQAGPKVQELAHLPGNPENVRDCPR
jgi:glutamine---fructose-6-phosphate transaminase (isomerizing)